ncbi:MAG: hypothetical protein U1F65_08130 [Verrucomicrobiota bacterium]
MKTKEVAATGWKSLCEEITASARGALVTLPETPPDGKPPRTLIDQAPLQSLVLDDQSNPCSNLLVLQVGAPQPLRHEIVEPIHLLLLNGQNERFNRLEVHSETGRMTLTFSPGLNPQLLPSLSR